MGWYGHDSFMRVAECPHLSLFSYFFHPTLHRYTLKGVQEALAAKAYPARVSFWPAGSSEPLPEVSYGGILARRVGRVIISLMPRLVTINK